MDDLREKVMLGLECCKSRSTCNDECPYYHIMEDPNFGMDDCTSQLAADSLALLKAQDATMLQGFLLDIPSSGSILNSVNCHAISLEDASRIIAICACACDVMSAPGFIHWLKERIAQDVILRKVLEE